MARTKEAHIPLIECQGARHRKAFGHGDDQRVHEINRDSDELRREPFILGDCPAAQHSLLYETLIHRNLYQVFGITSMRLA